MSLERINNWPSDTAKAELMRCCGSRRWAEEMVARRPFADLNSLIKTADEIWSKLSRQDWLEAFTHHPQIGDVEDLRKKFATTATWSKNEQAAVEGAGEDVLEALASGNQKYHERFGYIFIVCASGKTAKEMLSILEKRLPNDADEELGIAAGEQGKIMHLRLEKLCQEAQSQPTC